MDTWSCKDSKIKPVSYGIQNFVLKKSFMERILKYLRLLVVDVRDDFCLIFLSKFVLFRRLKKKHVRKKWSIFYSKSS